MNEREVLDALVALWVQRVQQHVARNACILAARTTSLVLDYFGVPNKVLACDALVFNTQALALLKANVPVDEWELPAWSIGITDQSPGSGYSGHTVCLTGTGNLIDLSAGQFHREGRINIDGPRVWQPTEVEGELIINEGDAWVFLNPKRDNRYRNAIDWRVRGREIAARIIRTINEQQRKDH